MTEKKITKRESFTEIKGILEELGHERLVKVMEHELDLLNRKNASGEKGMTATQKINAELAEKVLAEMEKNRLYTVTELTKVCPSFAEYRDAEGNGISNQKASSIMSGLVKVGKVERVSEKRRSYFRLVVED